MDALAVTSLPVTKIKTFFTKHLCFVGKRGKFMLDRTSNGENLIVNTSCDGLNISMRIPHRALISENW